jgi:hypothetical protein
MFYKGFWTHNKFMDVFIEVLQVEHYKPGEYTRVEVVFWNRSQANKPFLIEDSKQTITIFESQYPNWSKVRFKP